ncbi:hypothetical protein GNI_022800 [Gregarina niphandrodes]|uniref:Transmembrane protein n=1 Tax=Gregarina niphandrodes TaxID=110365 RepID=A0A023BBL2_GRENI|nr:hypothetical protein GNI_022800 [Gregarina niphandrodes]EZG80088.1 hypothetical protein GNI_022800 [Gregarina niphandrodes]|eukprot:XP_011134337.1 hypothetical protein GNI_022800 [Gregarina niphandrodes]
MVLVGGFLAVAAVAVAMVPHEYSGTVTIPYRCATCFGERYVNKVVECVDTWSCSTFVFGACHVYGLFGVEALEDNFVVSPNDSGEGSPEGSTTAEIVFAAKRLAPDYWLDSVQLETRMVGQKCNLTEAEFYVADRLSFEPSADKILPDLVSVRITGSGLIASFQPHRVKSFAYMKIRWTNCDDLYVARVTTEYIYGDKACPADKET